MMHYKTQLTTCAVAAVLLISLSGCLGLRYRKWCESTEEARQGLQELAAKNNWRLLVIVVRKGSPITAGGGVAELNFAIEECNKLYSTENWIWSASELSRERVAVIEQVVKPHRKWVNEENGYEEWVEYKEVYLALLNVGPGGSIQRILLADCLDPDVSTSHHSRLLLGDSYAVFHLAREVIRYDLETQRKDVLCEVWANAYLKTALQVEKRLYIMLQDKWGGSRSELRVFRAERPFEELRVISGTSDMIRVGPHLVLQKGEELFEIRPGDEQRMRFLARGRLMCAINEESFAYHDAMSVPEKGPIWIYSFARGTPQIVVQEIDLRGHATAFVAPGGRYLFVSRVANIADAKIFGEEYVIFDLSSGRKVGIFDNPFLNKYPFQQVVGWYE